MKRKFDKMMMAGALAGALLTAPVLPVQAAETTEPTETAEAPDAMKGAMVKADSAAGATNAEPAKTATAAGGEDAATTASAVPQEKVTRTWEVQAEYLEGRFFKDRHIDDYNIHIYQKNREIKNISVWYGLTLSRPIGYTTEDHIYRDSGAVGLGPSMMVRWERPVTGKLAASLDATGSLLAYNQAHPGDGRAYGFLWRIGPRLIYHASDKDAVSLGYLFHHSSNGWKHHNPGYNGVGFSLGWTRTF